MAEKERRRELRWLSLDPKTAGAGDLPISDEPFPPRDRPDIADLLSSVHLHGVLSPILVREVAGRYQIVCGYRRYLAARAAGLAKIPALVRALEDTEAIRCYLSAKVHRKPFSEEAQKAALDLLKELKESAPERSAWDETRAEVEAARTIPLSPARRPLDAASRLQSPEAPPAREAAEEGREDALGFPGRMVEVLARARDLRRLDVPAVESLAADLIEAFEDGRAPEYQTLAVRAGGEPLAAHSVLTAFLSARIAAFLGWPQQSRRDFVLAALLHDVGMVFVRRADLEAPRALTAAERAEVESHTRIGAALIAGAGAWSEDVWLCARDHHERWNGSGYPEGRRGSEVAFPARLMGLLDSYAALLGPRPHRNGLQPEAALDRLTRALELGLFDPSFLFLVRGPLRETPAAPSPPEALEAQGGKPVELDGALVTMPGDGGPSKA